MATQLSNNFKLQKMKGTIDFTPSTGDTFKLILVNDFIFSPNTHGTLADIPAGNKTAYGFGYESTNITIAVVDLAIDTIQNKAVASFAAKNWLASGGDIGPANGAILYVDTHADDCIVGFFDFQYVKTALDGGTFSLTNIVVEDI